MQTVTMSSNITQPFIGWKGAYTTLSMVILIERSRRRWCTVNDLINVSYLRNDPCLIDAPCEILQNTRN